MVAVKRIGALEDAIITAAGNETIEIKDRVRLKERNAKLTLISDGTLPIRGRLSMRATLYSPRPPWDACPSRLQAPSRRLTDLG